MDLQSSRKKLVEVSHASQELKNMYLRMNENERKEFLIGYKLPTDVDEMARILFDWSEEQDARQRNLND
ncbi:hypothetical protein [Alkalicoccus daliensis]|uniref:Uncharacterized protein n=1 Tax=Alkalicoccus daliensis TaxID=745820 RepID=A0A1H0ARA1_9BACI|nr:hypothetical protein [Alkalicoccus daliensis]SDN36048.1 hypothetical protein SAMN04488053_101587 [Alkalicoccus daliensis]